MAPNLGKFGNLLTLSNRRLFATQTASKIAEKAGGGRSELKQVKLPNGLQVIALDDQSAVTRIGVYLRAGPRCETADTLGVTHCLRNCAGLATRGASTFGITRNTDYLGGTFTATATREDMVYRVDSLKDYNPTIMGYLAETVTRPAFKPWEVKDDAYRMKIEVERLKQDPQLLLIENIHKAAFRGGLANSIFSPEYMIGHHDHNMLMTYFKENYVTQRMAVVGVGIEHSRLLEFVESNFTLNSGDAKLAPSKNISSEIRVDTNSDLTYAAVVAEGASVKNLKDVLAFSLFQQILGCGPRMKYNLGASRLQEAASKVAKEPAVVSSLNLTYSDAGAFGFVVAGSATEMHTVIKTLVSKLRESAKSVSEQELTNAKHALKANILYNLETKNGLIDEMGAQALNVGQVLSVGDLMASIDGIKLQDVSGSLSKLVKSKGAMASVGKLHNVPYLEDLAA